MILDDNLISIEDGDLTGATVTGKAIALNSFQKPGRMGPIPFFVGVVGEDAAGGTSITIKLQQSDSESGSYSDVPGSSLTVALADMVTGKNIGWRFLPTGLTKPWFKVVSTQAGTFTAGKLFAAVTTEDHLPYEEGMYIDAGVVKG